MNTIKYYLLTLLLLAASSLIVACGSCHDRKWLAAGIRNDAGLLQTLQKHLMAASSDMREKLAGQIDKIVGKKKKQKESLTHGKKVHVKRVQLRFFLENKFF